MSSSVDWAPTATHAALRARAAMLAAIRGYFAARDVLEVETPLLAAYGVTEPHLTSFETHRHVPGNPTAGRRLCLQTSPEFAMKRLLASGSGSIYQICKAFRNEERGRLHNPEFTLLEWYRVGFGLDELMRDAENLLRALLSPARPTLESKHADYRDLFEREVGVHPIAIPVVELARRAEALGYPDAAAICGEERGAWLDFLFSQAVQPRLANDGLVLVTGLPACLPSLARTYPGDPTVVERVEIYLDGCEIGNGFHELSDAAEQAERFERDNAARRALGFAEQAADPRLLAALQAGLPDCSGIAIGLDRLLMAITGASTIDEVLAFPIECA